MEANEKRNMNVMIVGSGGREHALGWKIGQSPRLARLYFAPGNAGTAALGENVAISSEDPAGLVNFAHSHGIDLVVVGPEAPLAAGLVDSLQAVGLAAFGPTRQAAQIEASKAFAKAFMARHNLPTARFATFRSLPPALAYLHGVGRPVVIKASGLAAGKGVVVPENPEEAEHALQEMLVGGVFGEAGAEVVIEERLEGPEVSLLAFSDGEHICLMPPAQDHKRLLAGDRGPNTGGMGAYAPTPICPPALAAELGQNILQKAVDGLRREGMPFQGVLYAGLMLTSGGARLLEFNCRFGDPETQAILPLLETDLLEIMLACTAARLEQVEVRWRPGAALCVVAAGGNYPGKTTPGLPISGLDFEMPESVVFHAGTRQEAGVVATAGGRVLGVTGWGADLQSAHRRAYQRLQAIHFSGMQYREDIGRRAFSAQSSSAYADAGVDIQAGSRAVELMSQAVKATYGPEVLLGIGAFGGLYDATSLKAMAAPVLVASTDGVGTKVKLAAQAGHYDTIGQDLVNHCINDILVQGARPLFFLDYFAASRLAPEIVASVVRGAALACEQAGIALLGGETAEMPGVYASHEFDLAGTIVGVVEREHVLPQEGIRPGNLLIGLRSSGPHTNGYSLIRKVFAGYSLEHQFPELGMPLREALLAPHRSYLNLLYPLLTQPTLGIKALAHLTGGGFIENIPRVLPSDCQAAVRSGSWPVPPLFNLIQRLGRIETLEMHRVFNMGIGMVIIADAQKADGLRAAIPEETWVIGEIVQGSQGVRLV